MNKFAQSSTAALGFALLVAVALLVRSSGHTASLEARITTLETDRATARKQVTDLQATNADLQKQLRPLEKHQAPAIRFSEELVVRAGATQGESRAR